MGLLRRIVVSAVLLLCLFSFGIAAEVSLENARPVAENWLQSSLADKRLVDNPNYRIKGEEIIVFNDRTVGFNFILTPAGHIIVPSRDELPAVKLYSFTTSLTMAEDSEAVHWIKEELFKLNSALDSHAAELAGVDHANTHNGRIWTLFKKDPLSFSKEFARTYSAGETVSLGPLVSTTWNQGNPYNMYTPLWFDGRKTYTGCVATAAAQILKYWNYPATGQGSLSYTWYNGAANQTLSADFASSTYNWSAMTNSYGPGSASEEKDAVAVLMSDIGIAFEMEYGPSGSGASTMFAAYVFPTYFKYKNTIQGVFRTGYANDSEWMQVFRNEVQNGRPSQFRINDPAAGGHSIVVDGYRDAPSEQIHLNLGWGGSYDGWYVSNNIVTGSYHWTDVNYQAAVIGIHPNTSCDNLPVKIGGSFHYFTSIRNAYNGALNDDAVQVQALDFTEDLDLGGTISVTLQGGYDCNYSSNPGVTLIHGTLTISGGPVTIENVILQ
jgi:hypothetical protein